MHEQELRVSGISPAAAREAGIYSESNPGKVGDLLGRDGFGGGPWLLFPYLDPSGVPTGYVRAKPAAPRTDDKGKVVKYEAPSKQPISAYFPPEFSAFWADRSAPVLLCEGEKKALAASQHSTCTIGIPGAWSWVVKDSDPRRLIPDLDGLDWAGRVAYVVLDTDGRRPKDHVRRAAEELARALRERADAVGIVWLPSPDGKKTGLDDYLLSHTADDLRQLLVEAAAAPPRPDIRISHHEDEVNEDAAAALAGNPEVFQRAGLLCRVVKDASPAAASIRRPFAPRIAAMPQPVLRERLAGCADWWKKTADRKWAPAHPPGWCVSAVHARGFWLGVPHLEGIAEYPLLRPDGSLLTAPGYDPGTGLLLAPNGPPPDVPDRPSREDAVAAVAALLGVVQDFPFARPEHRAAWLAALLTPLARFAVGGPVPLFLVDSNVRGAGKGLLLDVIAAIITGERFTVATYTNDEEELRKLITTLVMDGERLVLFDDVAGALGNATLDRALTGPKWKDRILGGNTIAEAPLYISWFATGNNVALASAVSRRICHVRLESALEHPEERRDFHHPDLIAYVRGRRTELLAAALTVLRAYVVAGRPDQHLPAWGSFEGWSALVRAAVVFAGQPDPGQTRQELRARADTSAESMSMLLACWEKMDPGRRGLTAAEVIRRLYKDEPGRHDYYADMRAAIEGLSGKADPRLLGYLLRGHHRRIFDGRYLDRAGKDHSAMRWAVYPAEMFHRKDRGEDGAEPSSPAEVSTPQALVDSGGRMGRMPVPPRRKKAKHVSDQTASQKNVAATEGENPPHPPLESASAESSKTSAGEDGSTPSSPRKQKRGKPRRTTPDQPLPPTPPPVVELPASPGDTEVRL
jgi:hypothetical protein